MVCFGPVRFVLHKAQERAFFHKEKSAAKGCCSPTHAGFHFGGQKARPELNSPRGRRTFNRQAPSLASVHYAVASPAPAPPPILNRLAQYNKETVTVKSAFDLTTSKMTEAKSPAKKAAKPKAKPAHPPTAAMVMAAVKALKEAKGSSLPAIKKYIAANYKVTFLTDFFF